MPPTHSLHTLPMKKADSSVNNGGVPSGAKKIQIKKDGESSNLPLDASLLSGKDKQLELLAQCLVRNSPMRVLMRATLDVLDGLFEQEAICLHQMSADGSLMLVEEKGIHEELKKKLKIVTPSSDYFWLSEKSRQELLECTSSYKNISDQYTNLYQDLEMICAISFMRFDLNGIQYLFSAWHAEQEDEGIAGVEKKIASASKVLMSLLSPAEHQFLSNEIAAQSQALKIPMGLVLRKYLPEIET